MKLLQLAAEGDGVFSGGDEDPADVRGIFKTKGKDFGGEWADFFGGEIHDTADEHPLQFFLGVRTDGLNA